MVEASKSFEMRSALSPTASLPICSTWSFSTLSSGVPIQNFGAALNTLTCKIVKRCYRASPRIPIPYFLIFLKRIERVLVVYGFVYLLQIVEASNNSEMRSALLTDGLVTYLLDVALSYTVQRSADPEFAAALNMLTSLWVTFPLQVQAENGVAQGILRLMRQGCRHSSRAVQVRLLNDRCSWELSCEVFYFLG